MRVARGAATIILVASLLALPIREAQAATLVVNSTADPGDGVCDLAECTLREAINEANADPAEDTIVFDITPNTIQPASILPTITEPLIIDGESDPDSARVELDGTNAGAGANGLTIDAPTTVRGLVINRFDSDGIQLNFNSDGTVIEGNFIGTDVAGTSALGNGEEGIIVRGPNTTIGGDTLAERNVIGGNAGSGIAIFNIGVAATFDNTITGNFIGVGADGTSDVGNASRGIFLQNVAGTTIGSPGAPNVVSANGREGIEGTGGTFDDTVIQSNLIGTDVAGASALGNLEEGIRFGTPLVASTVMIGGPGDEGNVISGNGFAGLFLGENIDAVVQGNRIGTNEAGSAAIANGGSGIVSHSPALIGSVDGLAAGGNVISGNAGHGVDIAQSAAGAVIQGNVVGTDPSTTLTTIGNAGDGIFHHGPVDTPSTTLIGGGPGFVSNVVSGNAGAGIRIDGLIGVTIQRSRIGTNAGGALPLPNGTGVVLNTDQATLGGTGADDGNVISGNTNEGVVIGQTADDNLIQGNRIGVASNGQTPVPNGSHGVSITAADGNRIGGTDPAAANVIASNGGDGVRIVDTVSVSAADNAILGNSITSNAGLGIDLAGDGVTANDLLDNDGGPNGRQNYPEIDIALSGGGTTWVAGTLHSEIQTTYRIEVFADPDGEGSDLIGSTVVTTDSSHNAAFTITAPVATAPGLKITATATELDGGTPGSTSEFSAPVTVPPCDHTAPPGGGTVIGTPGDDILCGDDGDDVFIGGGGNDFIFGGGGSDTLRHPGAAGPITVNLGAGRVTDDGEAGSDFVFDVENAIGSAFDDVIVGDGGPNILRGGAGDDVIVGGAGADRLFGGPGNDVLRGQGGPDVLRGQGGRDRLLGGAGADRLFGGPGNDVLRGQAGPDTLNGGPHVDSCIGGPGDDTLVNCEL